MTHETDTVRRPAWAFGTNVKDAQTAEEALRDAQLDWLVEKHPVQAVVLGEEGVTTVDVPERFATVRTNPKTDALEAIGVVGKGYRIVQNHEQADFLNALADESGADFDYAGATPNGRKVYVTMKVPDTLNVGGVDPVDLFLLADNSHDGSTSFRVSVTPVRVPCTNMIRPALRAARHTFAIRHTAGATSRVQEARDVLKLSFKYVDEFEREAERLIQTDMTRRQFDEIVADLWPKPDSETVRQRNTREQRAETMGDLFTGGITQENVRGTAWAGYNAISEWLEWQRPVSGGAEVRALRNLTGTHVQSEQNRAHAAIVGRI